MTKPIKKKIEPFYPKMEKLGIEYSIAFLVEEYFNKYMFPEKETLVKFAESRLESKNLYAYAKLICAESIFKHNDEFSEYVYNVTELLNGDSKSGSDVGKAVEVFETALADNHLIRWFREIDWADR